MNFTKTIEQILDEEVNTGEVTPAINTEEDALEYIKGFLAKGNNFEDIDDNVFKKCNLSNNAHIYTNYEKVLTIVQSWAKAKRTIQDAQNITARFLMFGNSIAVARALVEVYNSVDVIPDRVIEIWKEHRRVDDFIGEVADWCIKKNIPLQNVLSDSRLSPLITEEIKVRMFSKLASHTDKLKEMPQEWWEVIFQDIKKSRNSSVSWTRDMFCKHITDLVLPLSVLTQNFGEFIAAGDLSVPRQIIVSLRKSATREKKISYGVTRYLDASYFKNKQVKELLDYISKTQVDLLKKKNPGWTICGDIFRLYLDLKEAGLEGADVPPETLNLVKKMYEIGYINEFTGRPFESWSYDDGVIEDFQVKMIFRDVFSEVGCAIHFDYEADEGRVESYEVTKITDIHIELLDSNDELTEADLTPEELKHLKTYLYHAFTYYSSRYLKDYDVSREN